MTRLIKQRVLTFTRFGEQQINEYGQYEAGDAVTIQAEGALQPFRRGKETEVLPEGRRASDARVFFTDTLLRPSDEYSGTPADQTIIDGVYFDVFDVADWTTNNSRLAHYEVILMKKQGDTPRSTP